MVIHSNFMVVTTANFLSAMLVIVIYHLQLEASKEASEISRYISITEFSIFACSSGLYVVYDHFLNVR
jgi:hypothetical protein